MLVKKVFIIAGVSVLIASCTNQSDPSVDDSSDVIENHDHDHDASTLELNNGEKWKVVDGMLPPIQTMNNDIASFDGSTVEEYQSFGDALMDSVDELTSSCSMTGEAHDALHVWLVPYIGLVNDMIDVDSPENGSNVLKELKESMKSYNTYFE